MLLTPQRDGYGLGAVFYAMLADHPRDKASIGRINSFFLGTRATNRGKLCRKLCTNNQFRELYPRLLQSLPANPRCENDSPFVQKIDSLAGWILQKLLDVNSF